MRLTTVTASCLALGVLVSCGTSAERCEGHVAAEQRNVARLLQEVEANIARGYAYETKPVETAGFRFCAGGFSRSSERLGMGYASCYGDNQTIRQRVAIDPTTELRKRDALRSRLEALSGDRAPQCTRYR